MTGRKGLRTAFAIVIWIMQAALLPALANSDRSSAVQWSVQVQEVDPGNVNIEPAFRAAIYEHLLDELAKTKKFKHVFRSGDRNAAGLTLRANIDETGLPVVITEQGEKRNQP